MPDRSGYIPGVPCWVDCNQPDPKAALPAVVAYSFGASDLSLLDGNGATLVVLTAV